MLRDVVHRLRDGRPEDVGMPVDHLLRDPLDDFDEVEAAFVGTDLGVEHHLQQQVAQFLDDRGVIAGIDRFKQLAGFLERIRLDGFESLHPVPGAAVGRRSRATTSQNVLNASPIRTGSGGTPCGRAEDSESSFSTRSLIAASISLREITGQRTRLCRVEAGAVG